MTYTMFGNGRLDFYTLQEHYEDIGVKNMNVLKKLKNTEESLLCWEEETSNVVE